MLKNLVLNSTMAYAVQFSLLFVSPDDDEGDVDDRTTTLDSVLSQESTIFLTGRLAFLKTR